MKDKILRAISSKKAKRVISGLTAVILMLGALPVGEIGQELSTLPAIHASADVTYEFPREADGTVYVDIDKFTEYSDECQAYPEYHQTDKIVIRTGENNSRTFTPNFKGLGKDGYPFAGSIRIDSNQDIVLNLDHPLFNSVYDDVEINGGDYLSVAREYDSSITYSPMPLLAQKVLSRGNEPVQWNIRICSPSDNSGDTLYPLSPFAGLIGRLCKTTVTVTGENDEEETREYKADVTLKVRMITDISESNVFNSDTAPASINGVSDVGFVCGVMEAGTSLSFTMEDTSKDREVGNITTSSGSAGGAVGKMEAGSTLTLNTMTRQGKGKDISADGYAGGLVGENLGGTVVLKTETYKVLQKISGKSGSGGLYGHYTPGSDISQVDIRGLTLADGGDHCEINGVGDCGGLFGFLETSGKLTLSGTITDEAEEGQEPPEAQDNIKGLKVYHSSSSASSFGGLIGKYKALNGSDDQLTISGVTAETHNGGGAKSYGGFIGVIDKSTKSYVNVTGTTVTAYNAGSLGFGGLVGTGDNAFIDAGNVTVSVDGTYKGGGLVGSLEKGVLRLSGKTDLSGAKPSPPADTNDTIESTKVGQIVGYRDDGLVFADDGWKLVRCGAVKVDDIGSWGQVIRSDTSKYDMGDIFTVNTAAPSVTVSEPSVNWNTIGSEKDFVKLALRNQIAAGSNDYLTYTEAEGKGKSGDDIALTADVDLAGTGIVGLTRDNDIDNNKGCSYSGTLSGNYKIDLAIGETYGYRGNDSTPASSGDDGSGRTYRHVYNGLFGIANAATITDTDLGGTIDVDAQKATTYVGAAAGCAEGSFRASGVDISAEINYSGSSDLSIGGMVGEATSGIGSITIDTSTVDCDIDGSFSADGLYIGGVIGRISDSGNTDKTWALSNVTVYGKIKNDSAVSGNKVGGLIAYIDSCGSGTSHRKLTLTGIKIGDTLTDTSTEPPTETKKTFEIDVKAEGGSVGGILGHSWLGTNAAFNGVTVKNSTVKAGNGTSGSSKNADLAGMVYNGTGHWTIAKSGLTIDSLTVGTESGSAKSIGLIVNKGWHSAKAMDDKSASAVFLELKDPEAYTVSKEDTLFKYGDTDTSFTVNADELVAYSAYYKDTASGRVGYDGDADDLYVLKNGQGVVSIRTDKTVTAGNDTKATGDGLYMDTTHASGAYEPQTTLKCINPYTRYYYNIDCIIDGTDTSAPAKLMAWGLCTYAHSSIKTCFPLAEGFTEYSIPGGTYDMQGYSWYPVDVDKSITINGTDANKASFTFWNKQFELSDDDNAYYRSSLVTSPETTQHYTLHCALFRNVTGKLTAKNVTLAGNVGQIVSSAIEDDETDQVKRKYSGALVMGKVVGTDTAENSMAAVTVNGLTLAGIYVHDFASDYAPLLIDRSGNYSRLSITDVTVSENSYYTAGEGGALSPSTNAAFSYITKSGIYPKAGTSLIGKAGESASAKIVNVGFTGIQLDGRKTNDPAALDSIYHTQVSLFTRATLLEQYQRETGRGTYNYSIAYDWAQDDTHAHIGKVTYGKEVGYTSSDTNTEYPGQEQKYIENVDGYYTDPTTYNAPTASYFPTNRDKFLLYVAHGYNKTEGYHQLEVNHTASNLEGCGTYNDPYTITDEKDVKTIALILNNSTAHGGVEINVPVNEDQTPNLTTLSWHTNYNAKDEEETGGEEEEPAEEETDNGHKTYWYLEPVGMESGYYSDRTDPKADDMISIKDMRTYVAGAYFKVKPSASDDKITISANSGFTGFGHVSDSEDYARFRGVIVGTGAETIVNQTKYP